MIGAITVWSVHLNYALYALFFLFLAVNAVAERSLINNLKRHDPSTWEALGRPEFKMANQNLRGLNPMRQQFRFSRYILSMKYRGSGMKEVRTAGDISFGCMIMLWTIGIYLLTFGR